jgi:hypothetical protein
MPEQKEPFPPEPKNGADVSPEDGPQDVSQDPDTVVHSEVPDGNG